MLRPVRAPRARWCAPVLALALVACGGGEEETGDAERFCGEIAEHRELLTGPDLGAAGDVDAEIETLLDEYRRIGRFAPLAIAAEWDQLTDAYAAAAAVEPDDPESEQEALEAIFRSERSAVAIATWLRTTCAVDIGPVATIVPEPGSSTTTTTEPPTDPGTTTDD